MLRRFSIGLLASAVAIAPLPLKAQNGSAEDLGDVMSINLKDVVTLKLGLQGALQGSGTPNEAGVGLFLPLKVGSKHVIYFDFMANANFGDFNKYIDKPLDYTSSIINTTVSGTTVSTSTRLGYRWLNNDNSWMLGFNTGVDTRPMATAYADNGLVINSSRTVFFRQAVIDFEMISPKWGINACSLFPNGNTEQRLNNIYEGGALTTYGANVGYSLNDKTIVKAGYYYQDGDLDSADGPGALAQFLYYLSNDLSLRASISYDEAWETNIAVGFLWRTAQRKHSVQADKALRNWGKIFTSTPDNRNVRVHDCCYN